jgi:hypothetical protein
MREDASVLLRSLTRKGSLALICAGLTAGRSQQGARNKPSSRNLWSEETRQATKNSTGKASRGERRLGMAQLMRSALGRLTSHVRRL